jgi:hypothetical protein
MNVGDLVRVKGKDKVFVFPAEGIDLRKETPSMSPDDIGLIIGHRTGPGSMIWVKIFTRNGINGWIQPDRLQKISAP